jgi:hypothetical protein
MWRKPRWWREFPGGSAGRPHEPEITRLEAVRRDRGLAHDDFAHLVAITPKVTRAKLEVNYRDLRGCHPPDTPERELLRELLGEALGVLGLPWSEATLDAAMTRIETIDDIWFFLVQQQRERAGADAFDEFTAITRLG